MEDTQTLGSSKLPNVDPSTFPRLPPERQVPAADVVTRAAAVGLASGAGFDLVTPQLANVPAQTTHQAAILAAAAGALLAGLRVARQLCEDREGKPQRAQNLAVGGTGGLAAGGAVAALSKAALFSLVDGGILLGCIAAGLGAAWAANRLGRKKVCPHCSATGSCTERVCRRCYKIFFPDKSNLDCASKPVLTWYALASQLQNYELTYFDSEALARDHMHRWRPLQTHDSTVFACSEFAAWVRTNLEIVVAYSGKGLATRHREELDARLAESGL